MNSAGATDAIEALTSGVRMSPGEAMSVVPNAAGLYAIYGDEEARRTLDFPGGDSPLYVGKAERSLVSRDLRTHFATGKTGSSTLRRTVAALLRVQLELHAVPRNLARPDGSANFGLAAAGDERLTKWMHDHLRLAVWVKPAGCELNAIETMVLAELMPPLNLAKMGGRASKRVKAARAVMAAEARSWSPES